MPDKITVQERFGAWFRTVLNDRDAFEACSEIRELWLDLCGALLDHNQDGCVCVGCKLMRVSEWNAHMAAAEMLNRHDKIQERQA